MKHKAALIFSFVLSLSSIQINIFAQPFPASENLPAAEELPDPFTMMDGSKVTAPDEWNHKRRPELKQLFQHYMYGYMPSPPGITFRVVNTVPDLLNGKATLKEIDLYFNDLHGANIPVIHLALFVPNRVAHPVPVFLGLNKCGNYTVLEEDRITIHPFTWRHNACEPIPESRGVKQEFWCVEYLIDRGYAFATFHESDIDPDQHDFTDGIHPYYADLPGPNKSKWGTIAAWAWGLQRCVDYLCDDEDINTSQICFIGHSRRGKAALLAAAFDKRVAMVVPHQSGTGGAALSRRNNQETIERINHSFPHWFNDHFTEFHNKEEKLPIDQHLLMALVAPRLILDTAGLQDTWANYESALQAIKAAQPVYDFLDVTSVIGDGIIDPDDTISAENPGRMAQFRLDTKHTLNQDYWRGILTFADYHFEQ